MHKFIPKINSSTEILAYITLLKKTVELIATFSCDLKNLLAFK